MFGCLHKITYQYYFDSIEIVRSVGICYIDYQAIGECCPGLVLDYYSTAGNKNSKQPPKKFIYIIVNLYRYQFKFSIFSASFVHHVECFLSF